MSRLLLVRHAQSLANQLTHDGARETGPDTSAVRWRLDLVDCPISDKGREECVEAALSLKEVHIDVVYVSPLYRTLQTCQNLFANHPSNPRIIVQPLAYETMCCACDLSSLFTLPHPEFQHFDWSLMPVSDYWHFAMADNELIREIKQTNKEMWHSEAVRRLQQLDRRTIETRDQFVERIARLKVSLKATEGSLVLVTHAGVIQEFTRTETEVSPYVGNCQIYDASHLIT